MKLEDFRVISYSFKIILSPLDNQILITTIIKISSLQNKLKTISFKLNPKVKIISIKEKEFCDLEYSFIQGKIKINLSKDLKLKKETSINIAYLIFNELQNFNTDKRDFWMRYDSVWYPITEQIQFSSFKCLIHAPKKYYAISHGKLVKIIRKKESNIFFWEEKNLISRFCMIFGDFYKSTKYKKNLEISFYYTSDQVKNNLNNYFDISEKIIEFFNKTFCKYPYKNLKIIEITDEDKYSGYSDPSIIMINNKRHDNNIIPFLAHEIAHQWWGNLIIFDEEQGNLLNECFAEISSFLYFKKYNLKSSANIDKYFSLINLDNSHINNDNSVGNKNITQLKKYIYKLDRIMCAIGEYKFKNFLQSIIYENIYNVINTDEFVSNRLESTLGDVNILSKLKD
ncbi:MAG: hypothetical protein JXC36_02120 [Candidatus Atribacteria bacterium]|nr:hypothetical protein [Candidatus Atribacteria bacterium]